MPVTEYTAGQVKQAVVGGGRAEKPQVQAMVRAAARSCPASPQADAADALAARSATRTAATGVGALARAGYRAARRPPRSDVMRLARRPRAVIFDMDGLMLDTEPLAARAWTDAATACGVDVRHGVSLRAWSAAPSSIAAR